MLTLDERERSTVLLALHMLQDRVTVPREYKDFFGDVLRGPDIDPLMDKLEVPR